MADASYDVSSVLTSFGVNLLKYIVEGLAVAVAMAFVSQKIILKQIVTVALVAMAMFAVLDFFTPGIAVTARQGAGFGLGANLVGFPMIAH